MKTQRTASGAVRLRWADVGASASAMRCRPASGGSGRSSWCAGVTADSTGWRDTLRGGRLASLATRPTICEARGDAATATRFFRSRPEIARAQDHRPHRRTPSAGARMVDFGGWDMPVDYGSQIDEHHAVAATPACSMFAHVRRGPARRGASPRAFLRYCSRKRRQAQASARRSIRACFSDAAASSTT